MLNPDSISVKGCSYIYAPAGQAGEYAPLAANPYRGCGHGCAYCYVPQVLKIDRAAPTSPSASRNIPMLRGLWRLKLAGSDLSDAIVTCSFSVVDFVALLIPLPRPLSALPLPGSLPCRCSSPSPVMR